MREREGVKTQPEKDTLLIRKPSLQNIVFSWREASDAMPEKSTDKGNGA